MPLERGPEVEGKTWDEFLAWFAKVWRPGQHVALISPTGGGKSTFALGILGLRRYILALDAKGGDSTLASSGWERLTEWPIPPRTWDRIEEQRAGRFIIGMRTRSVEDRARLVALLRRCLEDAFELGGFTIYADEFQLLSDRKLMNLGALIEEFLIAARDRGSSVVTSYQAPAWVPRAASRQASWIVLWPTRDEGVIKALAAIIGRPWRLVMSVMEELPPFHVLVVGLDPRAPMVVTKAPMR